MSKPLPESWRCVDCNVNTAPGCLNNVEAEQVLASGADTVNVEITSKSEIYSVRDAVWKQAGMKADGGCLCIGCLEKRIGRQLTPKDFPRQPLNHPGMPGTKRLLSRRRGKLKKPKHLLAESLHQA
jgi:hypothetical protein